MKKGLIFSSLILVLLTLSGCQDKITFELVGDEIVYMETGQLYEDAGAIAEDGKEDISQYFSRDANIDIYTSGDYTYIYTLEYGGETKQLTRYVYYREPGCKPVEDSDTTMCKRYFTKYLHTTVSLTMYYEGTTYHDQMDDVYDHVEDILTNYHVLTTKYDSYDGVNNVYAINQDPTGVHVLEPELYDLISFSLDHQDDVFNLFNIALGPVLKIWHDAREACNTYTDPVCEVPLLSDLEAQDI